MLWVSDILWTFPLPDRHSPLTRTINLTLILSYNPNHSDSGLTLTLLTPCTPNVNPNPAG